MQRTENWWVMGCDNTWAALEESVNRMALAVVSEASDVQKEADCPHSFSRAEPTGYAVKSNESKPFVEAHPEDDLSWAPASKVPPVILNKAWKSISVGKRVPSGHASKACENE